MKVVALCAALLCACSANDDIPAPRLAAINSDHAMPGTSVTITGEYFCQQMENEDPLACTHVGSVQFGTIIANVTTYADAEIVVEVPGGTGVQVTVSAAGRLSNSHRFTIE